MSGLTTARCPAPIPGWVTNVLNSSLPRIALNGASSNRYGVTPEIAPEASAI
jgi:hypothetical protein